MEPGEEIAALVDELEQLIVDAKPPFGGGSQRKVVDAQDVYEILDDMRSVFPREFQEARRVLREEGEMLDRAQKQADAIIADAQQQAMVIAGDQEIVRIAQQQADAIKDAAQQYERDTRYNAEEYADSVLAHLEDHLRSMTGTVTRVRQTLNENSGVNNQSDSLSW